FERVRSLCDKHQILFVADEVMTGLGRTGRWLGLDHWNVTADICVLGKGLSAGYAPIAGLLLAPAVAEALRSDPARAVLGHTYSGNPLACATALAVLRYLDEHDIIADVPKLGAYLHQGLVELKSRHPVIADVRGLGLLRGVELQGDGAACRGTVDDL